MKLQIYKIKSLYDNIKEWSEVLGTYNYMKKAQGKSFNRKDSGVAMVHTDVEWESVHSVGQGYGYAHSREVMINWYESLFDLITLGKVEHIILISHIKDKLIETKKGDIIESSDLNLTGKVKSIYASRVDALAFFYRKDGKGYLNFDNEYKVISGGRCKHLNGEIVISEKDDSGNIITFWEKVFLKA